MAKSSSVRTSQLPVAGGDILAAVPTVEFLEGRLSDLKQESLRVQALLQCVRQMHELTGADDPEDLMPAGTDPGYNATAS